MCEYCAFGILLILTAKTFFVKHIYINNESRVLCIVKILNTKEFKKIDVINSCAESVAAEMHKLPSVAASKARRAHEAARRLDLPSINGTQLFSWYPCSVSLQIKTISLVVTTRYIRSE